MWTVCCYKKHCRIFNIFMINDIDVHVDLEYIINMLLLSFSDEIMYTHNSYKCINTFLNRMFYFKELKIRIRMNWLRIWNTISFKIVFTLKSLQYWYSFWKLVTVQLYTSTALYIVNVAVLQSCSQFILFHREIRKTSHDWKLQDKLNFHIFRTQT